MKLIEHFEKFLIDTVNLNKTRYDTATSGIEAITTFLKSNEALKGYFVATSPQGSYKQKTIIRPVSEDHEFDVDLLYEMKIVEGWEAKDYSQNLANEFRATDRYKDKVDTKGKNRCVTIDYDSDFHIDVIPMVKNSQGSWIMNKNTNEFEITDGDGYVQWFENQTVITNGYLVESVRLLKYIRDTKEEFEAKSILLTTLFGNQVYTSDGLELFIDLPTTLKILTARLDQYLQENPQMPLVTNPALLAENFNRHWNQEKYSIFRDYIHDLATKINTACTESDKTKSISLWRDIFGDDFPESQEINQITLPPIRDPNEQFLGDFGIVTNLQYKMKINANIIQNGFRPFLLLGSRNPLRKQRYIELIIEECFVPGNCDIKWKVKNYGAEATRAGDLRGEISDDKGGRQKREHTKYQGEHYVECYAIQNGVCVAKDKIVIPIGQF